LIEGELWVRASIGVAEHDGGEAAKTLRRADAALLEAKAHVRSARRSRSGRRAVRDA
jgi:PleD family two-component response regulator